MAAKLSAGVLLHRCDPDVGALEVLLVHPGGPYFRKKDAGYWTIPKGEPDPGEALIDTARREFAEELGRPEPEAAALVDLGQVKQKGGKVVHAFALEGDLPQDWVLRSNMFEMEWPPRSGRRQAFPEIDRAEWFDVEIARDKINQAQVALLDRLEALLQSPDDP